MIIDAKDFYAQAKEIGISDQSFSAAMDILTKDIYKIHIAKAQGCQPFWAINPEQGTVQLNVLNVRETESSPHIYTDAFKLLNLISH